MSSVSQANYTKIYSSKKVQYWSLHSVKNCAKSCKSTGSIPNVSKSVRKCYKIWERILKCVSVPKLRRMCKSKLIQPILI